jgi:hypothetical protein
MIIAAALIAAGLGVTHADARNGNQQHSRASHPSATSGGHFIGARGFGYRAYASGAHYGGYIDFDDCGRPRRRPLWDDGLRRHRTRRCGF